MKIIKTKLPGVFSIEPNIFTDERGMLIKAFHKDMFAEYGLVSSFEESLYSVSKKGVIRGMHFQIPPKAQVKLVYVSRGSILDVILDIRKGSPTYGQFVTLELSEKNHLMAYIPEGCAHGFVALEDNSCVIYLQGDVQSPENERGININSFALKWNVSNPVLSKKDQGLPPLVDYDSPFVYKNKI